MQGKVMPEPNATPVYAGVDVCKEWLDVHVHPSGQTLRVSNDGVGLRRLKRLLGGLVVCRVVMEATGKHHRAALRSLHAAGLAVAVVNPLRARLFAEAAGQLAKTDTIDARLLAIMGAALEPAVTPPPPEALEEVCELVNARTAAMAERTALSNRLATAGTAFLKTELRRLLQTSERHIKRLDAEIERRIMADPGMARRHAILCSIPGIGSVTAASFLTGLAELGHCSAKQAAMLAGVAPVADDSGARTGRRAIRGGRRQVRNAAYMAALSASRYNPDLAAFARRLQSTGKRPKIVLVAVMRKLIVLANTLIKQNRLWSPINP
ncbi:IS110 family transposase [Devosia sp.]|uniref:IS110 family transposase n=1 Tax=Devosia sp. TaxID=1871048 RepID=UPI003BA9D78C